MKKSETFVRDVATVFIALSVMMAAAYSLGLSMGLDNTFGKTISDPKNVDHTDPFNLFLFSHLQFVLVSGIVFEVVLFGACIGLLSQREWARKTALFLFGFLLIKRFLFFIA